MMTQTEPYTKIQNEALLARLYDSLPMLMGIVEILPDDILHLTGNIATAQVMGFTSSQIQNRLISELTPSRAYLDEWLAYYRTVVESGLPLKFEYQQFPERGAHWMSATLTRMGTSANGNPLCTYLIEDITDKKNAELALAENTRLLALSAAVGKALTEANELHSSLKRCTEAMVDCLEVAFARIWTVNEKGDLLELQASSGLYTHLDGAHSRIPVGQYKIGKIAEERKPHLTNSVIGDPRVSDQVWAKQEGMIAFAGHPLVIGEKLIGVMALFARHPLTGSTLDALAAIADQIAVGIERQQTAQQLRQQADALETIHRIGQVVSAELDLKTLIQATTDAATEVTGAQFGAFFYNVLTENNEQFMLYTLSGADPEKFAKFPMPRFTEVFAPTFRGESTIRLDDVTSDSRYGKNTPFKGLPPGHLPVVSYLAVPVVSRSGEVIGGLLFGHGMPGRFTAQHAQIVEGLAAQAAIAIDNARLYEQSQKEVTERKQAQDALSASEKQLRLVMDAAPMLITYLDTEHRYRMTNKKYTEWFGVSAEESRGKLLPEVIGETAYTGVKPYFDQASGGERVTYEREMHYGNGSIRYVHTELVPDFDTQGNVQGIVVVVSDISESKRQQIAVIESERRYRFLAESIPMQIFTAEPGGDVDYYNGRWSEYTGLSIEQIKGWGWDRIVHPDDLQTTIDEWTYSLKTGKPLNLEQRLLSKDGIYRWFLARANTLKDTDGNIVKWFGAVADIDDQKRAEQREHFLSGLGERIRSTTDPQEVLWASLQRVGEYLHVSRAYYAEIDPVAETATISRDYCQGVESWAGVYPLNSFGKEIIAELKAGKTVVIEDTKADERTNAHYETTYLPTNIRAYLAVPMLEEGKWVSALVLNQSGEPRKWTLDEQTLLETVAERTRLAVKNAKLWTAERERTEQLARAIREVHHRVKNSLQGVSALLEMQIPQHCEMMPVETVREGLNQIKTIALVHDLLAHDQPIGNVDVGQVLTKLVELLAMGMKTANRATSVQASVEEVWIPTKAATSVALVVQELVTNAEKHSRKEQKNSESIAPIHVSLKNREGNITVLVSDCGSGFPPGFDPMRHANIGLELVTTLVRHDLQGEIRFFNRVSPSDPTKIEGGNVEFTFSESLLSE